MIFPLPEAEGAPELHPNFHFQPKRSGHPDWAQENLDKNNLKVNTDTSKDGDVEVEIREKDSNK